MHYIIDGYNLLFKLSKSSSLEQERHQLLHLLQEFIESSTYSITIIFDGRPDPSPYSRSHYKDIEIIFSSQGESADDLIINYFKDLQKPVQYTLVTSDKPLAYSVKNLNIPSISSENFIAILHKTLYSSHQQTLKKDTSSISSTPFFDYYLKIFEDRFKKEDS